MAKGIVRRIDELGRITLPMEYRRAFGIEVKAPIGMYTVNGVIHLVKADDKFKGIARELDELGRLTLPIECRRSLRFVDRQEVDMYVDGNELCVEKMVLGCIVCQALDDLLVTKDFNICRKHAHVVVDAVMED